MINQNFQSWKGSKITNRPQYDDHVGHRKQENVCAPMPLAKEGKIHIYCNWKQRINFCIPEQSYLVFYSETICILYDESFFTWFLLTFLTALFFTREKYAINSVPFYTPNSSNDPMSLFVSLADV